MQLRRCGRFSLPIKRSAFERSVTAASLPRKQPISYRNTSLTQAIDNRMQNRCFIYTICLSSDLLSHSKCCFPPTAPPGGAPPTGAGPSPDFHTQRNSARQWAIQTIPPRTIVLFIHFGTLSSVKSFRGAQEMVAFLQTQTYLAEYRKQIKLNRFSQALLLKTG